MENETLTLEKLVNQIDNIVLDNKEFTKCEYDRRNLILTLAVESLSKYELKEISKEEMLSLIDAIERFYDLDNPEVVDNKVTGKSFYIFKPVKKLTI
ncbi:hypothetical protein [Clostridium rectalis]|uniref:hypothetical protein n=1 Tax=Clostridium rectalis TaxID=2040295 RepID=UPI000F642CCD|nr:hypothetical protein [Clostridium rectalis]